MIVQKAFKVELRPDGEQARQMRRFAGSCRFVFNKALALQMDRRARGEKKLSYADLCKELMVWRSGAETAWLADAPIHPLQQTLKDLDKAYKNFFAKRAAFPRFKKKGQSASFRYPAPKQIKLDQANSRISLPKLGWVRYRATWLSKDSRKEPKKAQRREIEGDLRNATVSQANGKWFVSVQTEHEIDTPVHQKKSTVGIDMGIARFATLSDGSFVQPLNSFRSHERRLRKAQKRLSRKVRNSNNWKKAKRRVAKINARIANVRKDFLHKTSTTICKNHAVVVIEDLKIRNMSASAAGMIEEPGRNVRAKSGLNKSILEQGWFEFRRQLEYKMAWSGGKVIAVPARNTSRTCPSCETVSADNRRTQTQFKCVSCGHYGHADEIAAKNILRAGYARSACEVSGAVMPPAAGTHRREEGDAPCTDDPQ